MRSAGNKDFVSVAKDFMQRKVYDRIEETM